MDHRRACVWFALMLGSGLAVAQQPTKGTASRTVRVYVVVTTQSGQPVTDLDERDFSIWDNSVEKRITSFQSPRTPPSGSVQVVQMTGQAKVVSGHPIGAYLLYFDAAIGKEPNEYHALGVRVDRPNLNVIARQGYYAQP
jgi:hypothetical protein